MKRHTLFILPICVILIGCKGDGSNDSIACISSISIKEERYISSVFSNSELIQLETTDESLIGQRINKIKKYGDNYFISYDNTALVTFDRQGKFIRKIGETGRGPSEYTRLYDFDLLPDGNIIISDGKKLLLYSYTGKFIKAIELDIVCFNIKVIDEDCFLICASAEEYSVYLINGNGDILSKQLERDNRMVLGRNVAFFALGKDHILYQQDNSNNFLSFNVKTREFANIDLLCREDNVLDIEEVNKYQNLLDHEKHNPDAKKIAGIASYINYLFFVIQDQSKFKCYLLNTSGNTIDCLFTEDTIDDISFTNIFSLLNYITLSDSEECFMALMWPHEIIEGLNSNIELSEHSNYQRLRSLFENIPNTEGANPVLIELRR